jgi:hypothetical protein
MAPTSARKLCSFAPVGGTQQSVAFFGAKPRKLLLHHMKQNRRGPLSFMHGTGLQMERVGGVKRGDALLFLPGTRPRPRQAPPGAVHHPERQVGSLMFSS